MNDHIKQSFLVSDENRKNDISVRSTITNFLSDQIRKRMMKEGLSAYELWKNLEDRYGGSNIKNEKMRMMNLDMICIEKSGSVDRYLERFQDVLRELDLINKKPSDWCKYFFLNV